MRHDGAVKPISPIAAGAGMAHRDPHAQRGSADFGVAITHRGALREKSRVDPVSLAERTKRTRQARSNDPDPEPDGDKGKGQYVDVEV